ncbi:hypothetical protein EMPG_09684, partial [Blastomyces silverae]
AEQRAGTPQVCVASEHYIRKSGLRVVRETAPGRVAGEVQNGGGGATAGLWGVVLVFDEGATQRKAGETTRGRLQRSKTEVTIKDERESGKGNSFPADEKIWRLW